MNRLYFSLFSMAIIGCLSFSYTNNLLTFKAADFEYFSIDTVVIENRVIHSGSKIMTDQDALVVLPPPGSALLSISLYYTDVSRNVSDSSRIWVKSQRSWSCAPLGNAHPFQFDQYTLGLSENVAVDTGWNNYIFANPVEISSDSVFIWPDLIQQVRPRIPYALGNHNSIGNLTSTSCATPGIDHSVLDYVCSLTFLQYPECVPYLFVSDADSICYSADTIFARATIPSGKLVNYLTGSSVILDTTFQIDISAQLLIDMSICDQ